VNVPTSLSRGLWMILATPFDASGAVDHGSLECQVALAEDVGAQGVVALGVFGESAALDLAEQGDVVRTVAATSDLPVVVGLAGRTTAVASEQALIGLQAGRGRVAAFMAQINSADPVVVSEHLHRLHSATGVGIVLQDYPLVSGIRVSTAQVLRVIDDCAFVVAVKAEAPPTALAIAQLSAAADLPVFGGLGGVGLVDELACGAAGAMTGFSHPEGLVQVLNAYESGGFEAARAAWAPWLPLANFEGQAGVGLALRKELLHRRGILAHPMVRPPSPAAPAELLPLLDEHLKSVVANRLLEV